LAEYEFPVHKVANVQSHLQKLLETNYYLNRAARDAYRSYLLSYASHAHRDIFNVHELDLQAVGIAFGFTSPPRVDIALGSHKSDKTSARRKSKHVTGVAEMSSKKKHHLAASTGRVFSADNPYGKRQKGDTRQFSH
jgi:ATP-dependent RNA helicase DDX18/HAS1